MRRILWVAVGALLLAVLAYEYQPARYQALYCLDPGAVPWGEWMWRYDGYLIGARGCVYAPDRTKLPRVPPVVGASSAAGGAALWFVNGANLRIDWVMAQLVRTAASTGRPVVGFYNSTYGGRFPDALLDYYYSSAVADTLAVAIMEALRDGRPVHIRATSQGAVFTAKALADVRERLRIEVSEARTLAMMKNIKVETGGGAASRWPDGPKYVHYINLRDPVARHAGVVSEGAEPGRGAVIAEFEAFTKHPLGQRFRWLDPLTVRYLGVHGFSVYNDYRRPFDDLYRRGRGRPGVTRVSLGLAEG